MRSKSYRGIFVTGTDTGVGKTVVTAAIAGALRQRGFDIGVMKPFQTGAIETPRGLIAPDAKFLIDTTGVKDAIDLICPVLLKAPLAPFVAAQIEEHTIDLASVRHAYQTLRSRHFGMIVEGAGGLAVPIAEAYTMRELARDLDLPLLIVARPSLGTINHTVLTVEYARAISLEILGIVISNMPVTPNLAEQTSPAVIEKMTGVPILGYVTHDPHVDTDKGRMGEIVTEMAKNTLLERLIETMDLA